MALADTIARIAERSGGVPLCGGDRALAVVKTLKRLTQAFRTTIIVGTHDEKKSSPPSNAFTLSSTAKPAKKRVRDDHNETDFSRCRTRSDRFQLSAGS
jgi:hypothetical protein